MGKDTKCECNTLGLGDPSELLPVTTCYIESVDFDLEPREPMSDEKRAEVYEMLQKCAREKKLFFVQFSAGQLISFVIVIAENQKEAVEISSRIAQIRLEDKKDFGFIATIIMLGVPDKNLVHQEGVVFYR